MPSVVIAAQILASVHEGFRRSIRAQPGFRLSALGLFVSPGGEFFGGDLSGLVVVERVGVSGVTSAELAYEAQYSRSCPCPQSSYRMDSWVCWLRSRRVVMSSWKRP